MRRKLGRDLFGPFEGHLIGCEYDTRRLIRMSLQKVGDTYQGAAYEFTTDANVGRISNPSEKQPAEKRKNDADGRFEKPSYTDGMLQGPVCCAVAPNGDLYVGNLRDSGWGGGANVGSIVRLRPNVGRVSSPSERDGRLEKPSYGIAEVRATPDGFEIDFTRAVDRGAASRTDSYQVASYRRDSTPAYGGPDLDRRSESVRSVEVSSDGRRARLKLDRLRGGFVYEIRVKRLAPSAEVFHPDEAYFTLRKVP